MNATAEPVKVSVEPLAHVAVGAADAALLIFTLPADAIVRFPVVLVTTLTASFILKIPDTDVALFVASYFATPVLPEVTASVPATVAVLPEPE